MKILNLTVTAPSRLSSFLKRSLPQNSSYNIEHLLRFQHCRVNGNVERFGSYRLKINDKVKVFLSSFPVFSLKNFPILFSDEHLTIFNKPPHLSSEALCDATNLKMVHRLDRDTSGCFIAAKNEQAQQELIHLFRRKKILKKYLAVTYGAPHQPKGCIKTFMAPIARRQGSVTMGNVPSGQAAITHWEVLEKFRCFSKILCIPVTGRTHQIRLHLKTLKCPIVGDVDYGHKNPPESVFRSLLHAHQLSFLSPFSKKNLVVQAPDPLPELRTLFQ